MNQYGHRMAEHFLRYRPEQFAAIAETEGTLAYFTRQGEQIAAQIAERARHMAAAEASQLSSDYATRVGQLNMIQIDAEAAVMREVLPPPEPGVIEAEDAVADERDGEGEPPGAEPEDPAFEGWKADTLAALARGRLQVGDLTREQLTRLREATDNPRLLELAGIRDEDLRALGLM